MENLRLVSSPNLVVGLSPNPRNSIFNKPFLGFSHKSSPKQKRAPNSLLVVSSLQGPRNTLILEKLRRDCFASIFSSGGQHTSSVGVNHQIPVQPPSSNVGSPLFWIGVGVGLSALYSLVAAKLKDYAMKQAFNTLIGQMPAQNNQFNNAGFSPNMPFPFPPPPASNNVTPPFQFPPPPASSNVTPPPRTSPPPVVSQPVTGDVSASKVEEPPVAETKDSSEQNHQPKKYAFVDVSPEETFQKSAFESYKESSEVDSPKVSHVAEPVFQNGAAPKSEGGTFQGSSSTSKKNPQLSVEALEKMMEDPTVQQMVYPYLPEEMRNPTTFKWMLQNPMYRQQLQDMLNNMGGTPEWDNRMMDTLKNFDVNSPEVKQQFDQIGLTPEEVISKIMANPDVAMAFQNPRVQAAIMDCSQNPLSIAKYQNDKEVMDVFNKISELFPGVTGSP